jgi:hypothetical protein
MASKIEGKPMFKSLKSTISGTDLEAPVTKHGALNGALI